MKFGRLPRQHNPSVPHLSAYLAGRRRLLAPPPPSVDYISGLGASFGLMGNSELSDCTCAALGHARQIWTGNACPPMQTDSDDNIIALYSASCGYVRGQPDTDNGGIEQVVLTYAMTHGLPVNGGVDKLTAFVEVDPSNQEDIKGAIADCGVCYIGFQVPEYAMSSLGGVWDVGPGADDIVGGHAVILSAYDSVGPTCITWGAPQKMTWGFFERFCVAPETRVLTADLRHVPAGELCVGDKLMGFDEDGPRRRWKAATVLENPMILRPCYELEFDDGTVVRCSAEHRWLSMNRDSGAAWIETQRMRAGGLCASRVSKPVDVWGTDLSRDAGYLAGAFDGEGSLTQTDLTGRVYRYANGLSVYEGGATMRLCFAQNRNVVLDRVRSLLSEYGFCPTEASSRNIVNLSVSRRRNILRFLGQVRPMRLLGKFNPDLVGGLSGDRDSQVRLLRRTDIGEQWVSALKTTSGTFIAEGIASHNCDEAYALADADWIKSTGISPFGMSMDQLESAMQALRGPVS